MNFTRPFKFIRNKYNIIKPSDRNTKQFCNELLNGFHNPNNDGILYGIVEMNHNQLMYYIMWRRKNDYNRNTSIPNERIGAVIIDDYKIYNKK